MEYFFNINTGRVEQRPVEQNFYPGTNVPIKSMAEIAANQNVVLPNQTLFDPRSLQSIFPTNVQKGITASSAAIPFGSPVDIQQGFTRNTPSDQGTNFQFLPSANEADETDEVGRKRSSGGLADLFKAFLGFVVPGAGLLMGGGSRALEGIKSLNQRLRNTDFGRSRTGAEYAMLRRERKQGERAQEAMPDVYRSAREQGFTNQRGGFSTQRADRAGTSVGSGQFSSKRSTGRQGY